MAITPRTVLRNPLLLLFFTVVALGALFFLPCSSKTTCAAGSKANVQRTAVKHVAVKRVNVATIEAAKTTTSEHGWLGIEIQTLTPQKATYAGVAPVKGVLVLGLQDGRPAQLAGMNGYDVVTHFNGKRMTSACQLKKAVYAVAPGTIVPVRVIRDGKPMTLRPTLADAESARGCGAACK